MATEEWDPAELRRARKRFEIENGDISYKEIGRQVAAILRRARPVSVAIVSYWFTKREPKFSEGLALARVLHADPFAIGLSALETQPPAKPLASRADEVDWSTKRHAVKETRIDLRQGKKRKPRAG